MRASLRFLLTFVLVLVGCAALTPREQLEAKVREYAERIKKDPAPGWLETQAALLIRLERFEEALTHLDRLDQLDQADGGSRMRHYYEQNYVEPGVLRIDALVGLDRLDEAEVVRVAWAAHVPDNANLVKREALILRARGMLVRSAGKEEEATRLLAQAEKAMDRYRELRAEDQARKAARALEKREERRERHERAAEEQAERAAAVATWKATHHHTCGHCNGSGFLYTAGSTSLKSVHHVIKATNTHYDSNEIVRTFGGGRACPWCGGTGQVDD